MLLLIDSSQEKGIVALTTEGRIAAMEENKIAKDHASWLHAAIGRILTQTGKTLRDLQAVAVIAGPGSYTGLRVAMAAAKGFCYALKIPLISLNSLRVMAESMKAEALEENALLCPMIDARRSEVFTAMFQINTSRDQRSTTNDQRPTIHDPRSTTNDQRPTIIDLTEILPPQAQILDKNAFETVLSQNRVLFFGSGAAKWKEITESPGAIFKLQPDIVQAFASLAQLDFDSGNWADPVYSEPVYLKEFFSY
jgi:tRNA threonylcarbamoyladenosine biosynthesis protein TsaB